MTEFFYDYSSFLVKAATLVILILALLAGVVAIISRGKDLAKEKLEVTNLNDKFKEMRFSLNSEIMGKETLKQWIKDEKKQEKLDKKSPSTDKNRVFVLNFNGDIKASALESLREEITAIITIANDKDEVIVKLESGGGMVHAYGLASSQLIRLRKANIPLTISIDKVAASGGYMMACVANKILAAPFAIVGSIGVIAQIPNFNRLLRKHDIDFEQMTAGEFKRTLTMFGENTDKAREKFKDELEDTHNLFKDFITEHRPQVKINQVATGEHWLATRAIKFELVDELITSDDYLLQKSQTNDLYEIKYTIKKSIGSRMGLFAQSTFENLFMKTPHP